MRLAVCEKRVVRTRPVTASPINQMGCIPIHVLADAEKNRAPVCTFLFSSMLPKRLNAEEREPEALCSAVLLAVVALDCSAADIVDQTSCKAVGGGWRSRDQRPFQCQFNFVEGVMSCRRLG